MSKTKRVSLLSNRERDELNKGPKRTIHYARPIKKRVVIRRGPQQQKNNCLAKFESFFGQLDRTGCTAPDLRHMRTLVTILEDRIAMETTFRIGGRKATATRRAG